MRTFDQGVLIEAASDAELRRQLDYTLDRIVDNRRAYPAGNDPRMETVRAIIAETERRATSKRESPEAWSPPQGARPAVPLTATIRTCPSCGHVYGDEP